MKKILTALAISVLSLGCSYAADDAKTPETKTVCVDIQGKDGKPVVDPKTGKTKQDCKKVKVHKKFEGTKIEDAKKK